MASLYQTAHTKEAILFTNIFEKRFWAAAAKVTFVLGGVEGGFLFCFRYVAIFFTNNPIFGGFFGGTAIMTAKENRSSGISFWGNFWGFTYKIHF